MTAISSSFFMPTRMSASTPRSAKMRTAAGLSSSAMSTLGMVVPIAGKGGSEAGPGGLERPVEPGHQRLEVGGLDGGAAPEPQAGRRVAVARDVVGDLLLGEQLGHVLDEGLLRLGVQRGEGGVGDGEADRGWRADLGPRRQEAGPAAALDEGLDHAEVAPGPLDERRQAADALGPGEAVERVLDREHRGGVDGLALEDALDQLAALGEAENLGQRPGGLVGFEPRHRAWREDQHAVL